MARYDRYRPSPSSRSQPLAVLGALGVLALVALMAWIWWYHAAPSPPDQSERPATAHSNAPTPLLPRPVNLPAVTEIPALPPSPPPSPPLTNALPVPHEVPPGAVPRAVAIVSNAAPAEVGTYPRPASDVFEMQLALTRQGISPGSLDGVLGFQTRSALRAFQRRERLPESGAWDTATRERLVLSDPPWMNYTVTSNDLARLRPVGSTWLLKSQQTRLDYESLLELVAEKSESHPDLVRRLNPGANWKPGYPGMIVQVPNISAPAAHPKAALVRISLGEKILEAFDAQTNLLVHFPCSIAARLEKRPIGTLSVTRVVPAPNYVFDPANFPESAEGQLLGRKLILPPGPNNPVGTAWISLNRPGYGIHGTPRPEEVGRTESHGCFRLANWNANYLLQLVRVGTPVVVTP
jgi:lipoprotein-anchoring transpeptidase ErfK/SrfK